LGKNIITILAISCPMGVYKSDLSGFLKEDIGRGDITSATLFKNEQARAYIFTKQPCILAGLVEAIDLFALKRLAVFPKSEDGAKVAAGTTVLEVGGKAKDMLQVERTALNILSRMSGIATQTGRLTELVRKKNPSCQVAATRKTTPGFRFYEKKAVVIGGGNPHRFGLFDAILVKDNHIAVAGGLDNVLERVKGAKVPVEIEVEDLEGALKCAQAGIDIIMLDNFTPRKAEEAYDAVKKVSPATVVEVSGGITEDTIAEYACSADIISLGSLTHTVRPIDFSMEILR